MPAHFFLEFDFLSDFVIRTALDRPFDDFETSRRDWTHGEHRARRTVCIAEPAGPRHVRVRKSKARDKGPHGPREPNLHSLSGLIFLSVPCSYYRFLDVL